MIPQWWIQAKYSESKKSLLYWGSFADYNRAKKWASAYITDALLVVIVIGYSGRQLSFSAGQFPVDEKYDQVDEDDYERPDKTLHGVSAFRC